MPIITRLESNNPQAGGVVIAWDVAPGSFAMDCTLTSREGAIVKVEPLARRIVEGWIEELRKSNRVDLLDGTNWVSVTACVCRCIRDWDEKRPAAPYVLQ